MDRGAWWAPVQSIAKSWTRQSDEAVDLSHRPLNISIWAPSRRRGAHLSKPTYLSSETSLPQFPARSPSHPSRSPTENQRVSPLFLSAHTHRQTLSKSKNPRAHRISPASLFRPQPGNPGTGHLSPDDHPPWSP